MKNTFGTNLSVTLFGESHGEIMGAVLDGMAPGVNVDCEYINKELNKRRGECSLSTARKETDEVKIVSGIFNGKTTGAPVAFLVGNSNFRSEDYDTSNPVARPSHADYSAHSKYHGFEDLRGGGHFSGRLTAPLVAAGALVESALENKGIKILSHISSVKNVNDMQFSGTNDYAKCDTAFPVIDEEVAKKMREVIESAAKDGDSVGGTVECMVTGMPCGVGEPFFDSLESVISHGIFSIPGIKGIEFGKGFGITELYGSEANDAFENKGNIRTKTNNSGGINGGISNGMPVTFKVAVRPTPSISKEQESILLKTGEEAKVSVKGRHDPAFISRICPAVNAITAIAVADLLCQKYGTDFLL